MSTVWQMDLPDSDKLVLLALADNASDEGACWPSIATIVRKCGRSERTVQGSIKRLVDAGHLTRHERPGRGVVYTVHPTPADIAPPQTLRPAAVAPTPAAVAGKPSKNHQSSKAKAFSEKFALPADIPKQAWDGFIEMRTKMRKPMTDRAKRAAIKRLYKFRDDGHDPGDVLDHCTLNSYQGIFPPNDNGNRNDRSYQNGRSPAGSTAESSIFAARRRLGIDQ